MTSKEFLILRIISSWTWLLSSSSVIQWLSQKDNSTSKTLYWFICFLVFSLSPSHFWFSFFSDQKWCIYRAWKLLEVSRIGLNFERHHLASKITPLGRIYNFQGYFVHTDNFISRKFLHKSYRTLCYLSRAT